MNSKNLRVRKVADGSSDKPWMEDSNTSVILEECDHVVSKKHLRRNPKRMRCKRCEEFRAGMIWTRFFPDMGVAAVQKWNPETKTPQTDYRPMTDEEVRKTK